MRDQKEFDHNRAEARLKICHTVARSTQFQVIVFTPNQSHSIAANRLCICDQCKYDYGSFDLLKSYKLSVTRSKETTLRSQRLSEYSLSRNCKRIPSA